jgi:hypothetical protein
MPLPAYTIVARYETVSQQKTRLQGHFLVTAVSVYFRVLALSKHYTLMIQVFIIYVPSQQLQGQLETQNSVHKSNYIINSYNTL